MELSCGVSLNSLNMLAPPSLGAGAIVIIACAPACRRQIPPPALQGGSALGCRHAPGNYVLQGIVKVGRLAVDLTLGTCPVQAGKAYHNAGCVRLLV